MFQQDGIRKIYGYVTSVGWDSSYGALLHTASGNYAADKGGWAGRQGNIYFDSDMGTNTQNPMAGHGAKPDCRPANFAVYTFIKV